MSKKTECRHDFEVLIGYEVCSHVGHFAEAFEHALYISRETNLNFADFDYFTGDEGHETRYVIVNRS